MSRLWAMYWYAKEAKLNKLIFLNECNMKCYEVYPMYWNKEHTEVESDVYNAEYYDTYKDAVQHAKNCANRTHTHASTCTNWINPIAKTRRILRMNGRTIAANTYNGRKSSKTAFKFRLCTSATGKYGDGICEVALRIWNHETLNVNKYNSYFYKYGNTRFWSPLPSELPSKLSKRLIERRPFAPRRRPSFVVFSLIKAKWRLNRNDLINMRKKWLTLPQ